MSFVDDFGMQDREDEILQPAREAEPEPGSGTYRAHVRCGNCGQGGPIELPRGASISVQRCEHCGVAGRLAAV